MIDKFKKKQLEKNDTINHKRIGPSERMELASL